LSNKETALIEGRQGEKAKARERMDNGHALRKCLAHSTYKIARVIIIARVPKNVIFDKGPITFH
jgi:hypothetical protein